MMMPILYTNGPDKPVNSLYVEKYNGHCDKGRRQVDYFIVTMFNLTLSLIQVTRPLIGIQAVYLC